MSRKNSSLRNQVRANLGDITYQAFDAYRQLNGIESESAAVARILDLFLLGHVGTLPTSLVNVSPIERPILAQSGPLLAT